MSNDDDWTKRRILEARVGHTTVTEAVSARIGVLLNGKLAEGQLSSTELAELASLLCTEMVPAPLKADAKP